MTRPLLSALAVMLVLTACGESRLNPFNWFGGSRETEVVVDETATPEDPRPLIDQIIALSVEPAPGGAIVRATGLAPTQGWHSAELVALPLEDGNLTYRFVAIPPPGQRRVSTQQSREVTVAAFLSDIRLSEIRQITVVAAQNARTSRR